MANITFKSKIMTIYNMDDSIAYEYIKLPKFTTTHCDMNAFRCHPKYSAFSNSKLFTSILAKIKREIFGSNILKLSDIPEGVTVDTRGFLAVVSFDV